MAAASAQPRWSVESALSTFPKPPTIGSTSPVPFFHVLERLKTTKREGWRRFGITNGESVADHSYRMALITFLAPPSLASRLDMQKCIKMALVHDMAESLVGDITPIDGITKAEKSRREALTIDYLTLSLLGRVGDGVEAGNINLLWEEYESGSTLESKFVHDVDKLELVLQMVEYERAHNCETDLGEFSWVADRIVLPEVRAWCEEVLDERKQMWEAAGKTPSSHARSTESEGQHQQDKLDA